MNGQKCIGMGRGGLCIIERDGRRFWRIERLLINQYDIVPVCFAACAKCCVLAADR